MKDDDTKKIQLLYEETLAKQTDYFLLENVENFNWDGFWNRYYFCESMYCYLFEEYKKLEEESDQNKDVYEITLSNNLKFKVFLNFLDKNKLQNQLMFTMMNYKNEQTSNLYNTFKNTNKDILNISFEDGNREVTLTGNVGNYTYSVLSGIKQSILNSLTTRNIKPDILVLYVKKNESKRLKVYQKFFKNIFTFLDSKLIDEKYDNEHYLTYFWRNI
jgi:hypothetical protein